MTAAFRRQPVQTVGLAAAAFWLVGFLAGYLHDWLALAAIGLAVLACVSGLCLGRWLARRGFPQGLDGAVERSPDVDGATLARCSLDDRS